MADHHIGFKLHIYPEEMRPLIKLFNHASSILSEDELNKLELLMDEAKDKALSS